MGDGNPSAEHEEAGTMNQRARTSTKEGLPTARVQVHGLTRSRPTLKALVPVAALHVSQRGRTIKE